MTATASLPESPLRPELGEFSSIVCFRALVGGVIEALGERAGHVALKAAGRARGHGLVESLDLVGAGSDLAAAAEKMALALGPDGTRLCLVRGIEEDGETIKVYLNETICMAGEPQGTTTTCSFTFGAVHGALEALTGLKLQGKHTHSPLRDDVETEIFEFHRR